MGRAVESACGVVLETWPRSDVASDAVRLSQMAGVVFDVLTAAVRLRDARFAADGMFDACTLLQHTSETPCKLALMVVVWLSW